MNTMVTTDTLREKLRSFYEKVMNDLCCQIDPLLGTISVEGLNIINKTTFDCIWREIESDLPPPVISKESSRFFGLKSKKQKLKEARQKMLEMAQAEFSDHAKTMGVKIASMQIKKENKLRRPGGR